MDLTQLKLALKSNLAHTADETIRSFCEETGLVVSADLTVQICLHINCTQLVKLDFQLEGSPSYGDQAGC